MPKASRLTCAQIEKTVPKPGTEVWLSDDDGSRGSGRLVIRISAGRRLWYFRYSTGGKRKHLPMGSYGPKASNGLGALTLEAARFKARQYAELYRDPATRHVKEHVRGRNGPVTSTVTVDSKKEETTSTRTLPRPDGPTLLDICNAYVRDLQSRGKNSWRAVASYIRCHIASTEWAGQPAASLTPDQAADILGAVLEKGRGTTAVHVQRTLHAAYEVAMKAGGNARIPKAERRSTGVTFNPIKLTDSLTDLLKARTRPVLTKAELGSYWLELTQGPHKDLIQVKFLRTSILLGGQRCAQLLRCKVGSVDLENKTILLLDGKGLRTTPREHCLPLEPLALAEVMSLLRTSADLGSEHLFPGRDPRKPLNSSPISRAAAKISKALIARKKLAQPFLYANIRSTIDTTFGSLNLLPHVKDQIQSHGIGGVVQKHYDKWSYLAEKRAGLRRWEKLLTEYARAARDAART